MTLEFVGSQCSVSKSTVLRWEQGEVRSLKGNQVKKLASIYGTTPEYIMGWESNSQGVRIPVLGTVRAVIPILAAQEILDYEEISPDMALRGAHFALKVKGDSMSPRINEGDVVIVRQQSFIENGEIAIVLVNGEEATVKRVTLFDEGLIFHP